MAYRVAKFKKHTRRAKKNKQKQTRVKRMRRMRGGSGPTVGSASVGMSPQTYTFTVATPISPSSTSTNFPSDLGTFTPANQQISFTNPTKKILDIKIKNGTVAYGSSSFGTSSTTKASISIGTATSLVPNDISVRGATQISSGPGGRSGPVTIKGLGAASFGTLPATLTFEVTAV